ncbi:hypothetical protein HYT23_06595 [Candidatus Pacearchaeota archaeon]|nr:hypothetical protein [Candidatus Pacearchaeota archaeon]
MRFNKTLGLMAILAGMYAGPAGTLMGNALDTSYNVQNPNNSNTMLLGTVGYCLTISTVLLAIKYRKDLFDDEKI